MIEEDMASRANRSSDALRATTSGSEPSAQFTPGPWEIGDDGPILYEGMLRPVWNIYAGKDLRGGRLVGSVEHFKEDDYPNHNARLIAAAPTMADYIARRAVEGDAEAAKIMEAVHGRI